MTKSALTQVLKMPEEERERENLASCAICGVRRPLAVHHLDSRVGNSVGAKNWITLCHNHHAIVHGKGNGASMESGDLTEDERTAYITVALKKLGYVPPTIVTKIPKPPALLFKWHVRCTRCQSRIPRRSRLIPKECPSCHQQFDPNSMRPPHRTQSSRQVE